MAKKKPPNKPLHLSRKSLNWAMNHLLTCGDTDVLPAPFEFAALRYNWVRVREHLSSLDLLQHTWEAPRSFFVFKDQSSFRLASQLDPLDSILATALAYTLGPRLEARRRPRSEKRVFSYRFQPMDGGQMFSSDIGWRDFWESSKQYASGPGIGYVLESDISDFYNQVYHHSIQNEIDASKLSGSHVEAVTRLLQAHTDKVSRGMPVGPHFAHLLAEASLISVDDALADKGLTYCRYVDDFHIFASTFERAQLALLEVARTLDSFHKLVPQRHKTRIVPAPEFLGICDGMLAERPLSPAEARLLKVVSAHSHDDPYAAVSLETLSNGELRSVSAEVLRPLLELYLGQDSIDYPRLGWLLRRLAQLGAPGAIDFLLDHVQKLIPVMPAVVRYFSRAVPNYPGNVASLGNRILDLLELPLVVGSEYLQLELLSLFGDEKNLNNLSRLLGTYSARSQDVRREIVRAAVATSASAWLRERKAEFGSASPWLKRAILLAAPLLPGDEGEFWIRGLKKRLQPLEKLVCNYAFGSKSLFVDPFS